MPPIVNIAAYQFVELQGLTALRAELRELTTDKQLRGTILLSPEGINVFVAGSRTGIEALLARLRAIPGCGDLEVKESLSDELPFSRMLVKVKREIIAFGVEGIEPQRYTSRRLSAQELKRWLDEGKPVTLLDTRNNFEVQAGTFNNAVAVGVDDFRDFPAAVNRLPDALKQQPVVTFCTGGIRCEKAAPYLEREGFSEVYQLDGGILKYFEQCGGAHFQGQCFVFDKRVSVDAELKEGDLEQCFVCQAILAVEEQALPEYVPGESCPRCYRSEEQAKRELLERRHAAIRKVMSPLPGSVPYENVRPITVPLRFDGLELLDFFDALHTHFTRDQWREVCAAKQLVCREVAVQPGRIVRSGEVLQHLLPSTSEPNVAAGIQILAEDDAIIVVNKPAPLPMHPCGRFNRNTLTYVLDQVYQPLRPRPAHRLDADTTGVVVFSKTREMARLLQPQFATGNVSKTYVALVHGCPAEQYFECDLPLQAEPGLGGIRLPDSEGASALTRFRSLGDHGEGRSLLEIEPLTGRTNQIRAHLWKIGMPIVGDPIYRPDGELGTARSLSTTDPPLCLHAATIEFAHPLTRERVRYTVPLPSWATQIRD